MTNPVDSSIDNDIRKVLEAYGLKDTTKTSKLSNCTQVLADMVRSISVRTLQVVGTDDLPVAPLGADHDFANASVTMESGDHTVAEIRMFERTRISDFDWDVFG
jgi:hypothetical protein